VVEQVLKDGSLLASSSHEILVADGLETKRMTFNTKLTLAKGTRAPTNYSCNYSSGDAHDSYVVAVRDGRISRSLSRNGRTSEDTIAVQPGFVIVDFNVYYQYDYLVRKYDLKKGGRQVFQNFMPVIAAMVPITLTRIEDSTLGAGPNSIQVQNFRVEHVSTWMGIVSCDKNGRLARLVLRDKGLEVIRRDLQPE
jgi:hypothetical protein